MKAADALSDRGAAGAGRGQTARAGADALRVRAAGASRPDDVLVFDLDRDREGDADEALALGTTSASFEVPLEDVIGGHYDVLDLPNGVDPLRSDSVATTVAVDFHKETNRFPEPARDLAGLQHLNADTALLAYAIPSPSHPDRSHVRIRCDATAHCRVYLACGSADGAHGDGDAVGRLAVNAQRRGAGNAREAAVPKGGRSWR